MIPERFRFRYPEPVRTIHGIPALVFDDHRWTLPALVFAAEGGLLDLPVVLVTLDRHRDSLVPERALDSLRSWRDGRGSADELVRIVADGLSPRDDDWIVAGMEAGLVSDAVQFRSERDDLEPVTIHRDCAGDAHRIFHLGLPGEEIAFRGALADPGHPAVAEGFWDVLFWNPHAGAPGLPKNRLVLDIDLDFFTIPWETYAIPFPAAVWRGEFLAPRRSGYADARIPAETIRGFARAAGILTIAREPDFCGGARNARRILADVDRFLFEGGTGRR